MIERIDLAPMFAKQARERAADYEANTYVVVGFLKMEVELDGRERYIVQPVCVSHPLATRYSISTGFGIGGRSLAERLIRAIDAGKAYTNTYRATDVNGAEYLGGDFHVLGRHLDADLKRLGF
jgi:hypothetical protein